MRIWDVNSELYGIDRSLKNTYILKFRDKRGKKLGVTTCRYTRDGKLVVGAGSNGDLQFFSLRTRYLRPDIRITSTHRPLQDITSICFFRNGKNFLTRAQDNQMKLWDLRNHKQPVNIWYNLPNHLPNTQVSLSPDENLILTACSDDKTPLSSRIFIADANDYDK